MSLRQECRHEMVYPATRKCKSCGEVLSKKVHMHLYGPWSQPYEVSRQGLWIIVEQKRRCTVGSDACGEWLIRTKRIPANNGMSREHVYQVDPG